MMMCQAIQLWIQVHLRGRVRAFLERGSKILELVVAVIVVVVVVFVDKRAAVVSDKRRDDTSIRELNHSKRTTRCGVGDDDNDREASSRRSYERTSLE